MTPPTASMPCLNDARAQWDATEGKVRYFASLETTDTWVEIPGEDFSRLVQHYAQEAIDTICNGITETLDSVKTALAEFMTFREEMEKLAKMTKAPAPEGSSN